MPSKHWSLDRLCREKRDDINKTYMKRKDNHEERFVLEGDLRELWSRKDFDDLFPDFPEHLRNEIREERIVFLTILVWIRWPDNRSVGPRRFRQAFRSRFSSEKLKDKNLPLDPSNSEALDDLNDPSFVQQFQVDQYIFKPFVIERNTDDVLTVPPGQRLPFCSPPEKIGNGAFGTIYKVKIAKGYFASSRTDRNDGEKLVAYKDFKEKDAFAKEGTNMQLLKGGTATHNNIMTHFCSLIYKDINRIFTRFTDLGDLEMLLNGGYQGTIHTDSCQSRGKFRYKFDDHFHSPKPSHFIKQLEDIASALDFIHDGSYVGRNRHCAHMDLKPNNILIFRDDKIPPSQSNIGKWVIADFGIASFSSPTPGGSMSNRTIGGAHRAPELQTSNTKVNRIQCDRWSFGCIVNDVFAFISGEIGNNAANAVENYGNFVRQRSGGPDDNWYERASSTEPPYIIKPEVKGWIHSAEQCSPNISWKRDLARLILDALEIKPDKRIDAKEMKRRLESIHDKCEGATSAGETREDSGTQRMSNNQVIPASSTTRYPRKHKIGKVDLKGGKCVDFDLAPDASAAAFLVKMKDTYKVYLLKPDVDEPVQYNLEFPSLKAGQNWTDICISGGILIIRGQQENESFESLFFNIKNLKRNLQIPPPNGWPTDCKRIIGSPNFVVWETDDKPEIIYLWHLASNEVKERKFDGNIVQKCFNANGKFLFVWAKQHLTHKFYVIDPATEESLPFPPIKWPSGDKTPRVYKMWPGQDSYLCAFQEARDGPRYIFDFGNEQGRVPILIKEQEIVTHGWISTLTSDAMFIARKVKISNVLQRPKHKVTILRRRINTKDGVSLSPEVKIDSNGRANEEGKLKIAVCSSATSETIVLCDSKAEYFIQYTPRDMIQDEVSSLVIQ